MALRKWYKTKKQVSPSSEIIHVNEEIYKKNLELAEKNKTLALLRKIDEIVLGSDSDLKQIALDISKAILNESDFTVAGIFLFQNKALIPYSFLAQDIKDTGNIHSINNKIIKLPGLEKILKNPKVDKVKEGIFSIGIEEAEFFNGEVIEEIKKTATQKLYICPLITREKKIGVMFIGVSYGEDQHTIDKLSLIDRLVNAVGVALENKILYEEIKTANKRLKELDKAKDEFISMASHQLRTPLTTIKGYLSMLLEGDAGKLHVKQQEFVDMAFVSSERMVHLIADMLNVSRISTGRLTIDKAPFNIMEVAKSEVEQLKRHADAHNVKLSLHLPKEEIPLLSLDEGKLRQVMMNFMDNAVYYTPNGQVDVYVEKNADMACFTVKDNGIGVSKEAQKQLFTKFFRAGNAQAVRPDGTGLGLYMAKQVVEAQGGRIIFSSIEGKGSTFGFEFPLKDNLA